MLARTLIRASSRRTGGQVSLPAAALLAALCAVTGCATDPARQAAQERRTDYQAPQIAAPDRPLPRARLELARPVLLERTAAPVHEPATQASRGELQLVIPLIGLASAACGPAGPACLVGGLLAYGYSRTEPAIGGTGAPPGEAELTIQPMLASARLGACLRDAVLSGADGRLGAQGRGTRHLPVVHLSIGAVGFDNAAATGERLPRGSVSLVITAEASLQQGATHHALGRWRYAGIGRPHAEWAAEGGAPARAEVDRAVAALRDRMLLDLYGLQPAAGDSPLPDCESVVPVPDDALPERAPITVPRAAALPRRAPGSMLQDPGPPGSEPSCVAIAGGDPKALVEVARARASGWGGWRQDRLRAYAWYLVAVRRGYAPVAWETDLLRAGLSEQDLLAAGQAAEAWRGGCEIGSG
jgi:hypothetical protein